MAAYATFVAVVMLTFPLAPGDWEAWLGGVGILVAADITMSGPMSSYATFAAVAMSPLSPGDWGTVVAILVATETSVGGAVIAPFCISMV